MVPGGHELWRDTIQPSRSTHPEHTGTETDPHRYTHTPLADENSESLDVRAAGSSSPSRAQSSHPIVVPVTWCFSSLFCFFWFGLVRCELSTKFKNENENIMKRKPSSPCLGLHPPGGIPLPGDNHCPEFLESPSGESPDAGRCMGGGTCILLSSLNRAPVPLCFDCVLSPDCELTEGRSVCYVSFLPTS